MSGTGGATPPPLDIAAVRQLLGEALGEALGGL